jgi:hypothetical protein
MKLRGALPGEYACAVKPSRRNSVLEPEPLDRDLVRHIEKLCRTTPFTLRVHPPPLCPRMTAGVTLNGRKYKQGNRSFLC